MLDYDFQSSIGYWLCTTAHGYECAMNELLTRQGITFRQCQVLAWLALEGEQSQIELASRMNIEPPTLVRVLDRMERDGLIQRGRDPADQRRTVIEATARGRKLVKLLSTSIEAHYVWMEQSLGKDKLAQIYGLLDELIALEAP